MKVLLIYPPRRSDSYVFPPTSLLYVAAAIRAAGHEAQIIDIPYLLEKQQFSILDNSLFDYILQQEFDMIGLGGVVSTYFFQEEFVKKIRKAKKNVPIVVGGSVGSPIRDVWAKYAPVDFLIEGEGELSIQKLLNYIEGKCGIGEVPGLHYLKDGKYESNRPEAITDLDAIPFLSYDELDHDYYIDELTRWVEDIIPNDGIVKKKKIRLLPLITSRGCPYSCTFCFHFNKSYRYNSTKYMIEYMKFLKNKYSVNCFYIIDDLFTANRKRTIELCDTIYKENLGVSFAAGGGKPSLVTLEMLESMKKAGFIRFSYGIESGSQRMLDSMKKGTTVEQNLNAIRLTKQVGIPMTANLVFGAPGENAQTLEETKKFLIKANLSLRECAPGWMTAYPGTPIFDYMKEKNIVTDTRKYLLEVGSISTCLYNLSELSRDALRDKVAEVIEDVDMAHYFREGQYLRYARRRIRQISKNAVAKMLLMLGHKRADKIRNAISNFFLEARRRKMKRSEKKSNIEIEKWVALTYGGRF